MGNIFLTAKSGDDNKGRGLHGGQWLKVLNFGRFLVGCNMGCKGPLQYRSLLTSVATCYGARLRMPAPKSSNTDNWTRVEALLTHVESCNCGTPCRASRETRRKTGRVHPE